MEIRLMQYDPATASSPLTAYLPELNSLINDAYDTQDRSSYSTDPFTGKRLKSRDQLLHELGSAGLAAIAFAPRPSTASSAAGAGASHAPPADVPVAIACLKPWQGRAMDVLKYPAARDFPAASADVLGPSDWEVALCASMADARFRGHGLVAQCVDTAVQHVRAAHGGAQPPLSLWVTALEACGAVEYWLRRGFVRQGAPDEAPAGTWGSVAPFRVATLRKVLAAESCV